MTISKTKAKLSSRSKRRLTEQEIKTLNEYINDEPAAYANIKNITELSRNTVVRILERGWGELPVATRLCDFIKLIPELQ